MSRLPQNFRLVNTTNTAWADLPEDLTEHPRWTLWRYDAGAKVPVDIRGRKTDPNKTWCSFDEAVSCVATAGADGIGVVLYAACGLIGLDFDDVSSWEDEAMDLVDRLSPYGYSELSPSGDGYRIVLRPPHVPESHRVRHKSFHGGKVEVYTKDRFLTITGEDARGSLSRMTRAGARELREFMEPLLQTEEDDHRPLPEGEETLSDRDLIFELVASAENPQARGAKSFREIHDNPDAFDECDDPSDLLVSAVCAMIRYTTSQEQVRRVLGRCAAAEHYVDRKTGKPKLERWLKSELPKLMRREVRSRETRARQVTEAREVGLFERFVWHRASNSFYDTKAGIFVGTGSLNFEYKAKFPGTRGAPLVATVLSEAEDLIVCDNTTWLPIPWREGDPAFCAPTGRASITMVGGQTCVNTWRGFAVVPRQGSVTPWLELLEHVIPDQEVREVIIDRMAFDVQFPDRKCAWHTVVIGRHGIGKDLMLQPLFSIFGPAVGNMSDQAAKSGYEDEYIGTKLIHYEEASGLSGSSYERLKMLATAAPNKPMYMNKKGEGKVPMRPLWSFYITSNHDGAMKVEATERRWLVTKSPAAPLSSDIAQAFVKWCNEGGVEAVFDFLLYRDLTDFDVSQVPRGIQNDVEDMVEAAADSAEDALDDFFTSPEGEEVLRPGIVNYNTLASRIRRNEGVSIRKIDVKKWLESKMKWKQIKNVTSAKKPCGSRFPTTLAAPSGSDLHKLTGKALAVALDRLIGPGADFHNDA